MESGNKAPDKFANSGLTASRSEFVDAPVINEFPLCLECTFIEYQDGAYGCGVIGKVVNVTADESVMDGDRVDMDRVNAIKFANSGLTASRSEFVDAPVINEFPLCLECTFIEYQDGAYGCGVIGKVVNVTADESVMDGDRVDMDRVNAIAFDPYTHGYYKVSGRVGEAFKDGLKLKK